MQGRARLRKTTEDDAPKGVRAARMCNRRRHRDRGGLIGGKAIDAGRDGGESQRRQVMIRGKRDRPAIAGGQRRRLARRTAVPHRTDRVDDMERRQPIAARDLGVARGASAKPAAFGQQFRPGGTMDGTIDAASAQQRIVGRVDDGIDGERRDIGDDDFECRRPDQFAGSRQAEAGASVTPLSANIFCNSPAWNISRMISQPPTNSPLT